MHARPRSPAGRPRHATVYVLVLGVAAIATAAGVGGLYVQRTRLRMARSATEVDRARVLAASGLEFVLARIAADANWRTTLGAGNWLSNSTLGTGTLSVAVSDPIDADITDAVNDPIRIASVGVVGSARQALAARVEMVQAPHSVLACGAYGRNQVHFGAATVTCDGPIASGANMTALLATVRANVEATGTVTGLTYMQASTPGAAARTVPDATIADRWAAMGASINYASISSANMRRVVLAPALSAYGGALSDAGIYVVDCAGGPLTITETRILGTLVVLNTSGVTVSGSVRLDPLTAGYPCLIVEGPLTLSLSTTTLSESTSNTNFNPNGAPWQGATNATKFNTYATGMTGIVLATDDIVNSATLTMTGCLISLDALTFNAGATITVDPVLTTSPAPGFYTITPELAATGVERITY